MLLATTTDAARLRWAPATAVVDLAWVLGSLVLAGLADLSGAGRVLLVVQGVAVLVIGEAKLVLVRRARA